MGKYDPLRDRLRAAPDEIEWSFEEVSALVGGLPASAREHPAWWGNEHTHVQSAAWLSAGFRVESVELVNGRVRLWTYRFLATAFSDAESGDPVAERR